MIEVYMAFPNPLVDGNFRLTKTEPSNLASFTELIAEAFDAKADLENIRNKYVGGSHYDWDVSRLIWDEDRIVQHWGVWGYEMRLGSALIKIAGVGAVCTHHAYRKRGLMFAAGTDSLNAARHNGYDLAMLTGIHYKPMGFRRAWNDETCRIALKDLPEKQPTPVYRRLSNRHFEMVVDLYNREYQAFAGTAVRPTYQTKGVDEGFYGWFDPQEKLLGYIHIDPKPAKGELKCFEACGDIQAVLAVASDLAWELECTTLALFNFPYAHPIMRLVRSGICTLEQKFCVQDNWLVSLINLNSTLQKLLPQLSERHAQSARKNWQGKLLLKANDQSAMLDIDENGVSLIDGKDSPHVIDGG
ncbi:MAG TPA: GNAT family N-acetyltransferase, partial [Longilinea sp.]|nr:GNAT family N-acetyltransferase [Longilinea sp.]